MLTTTRRKTLWASALAAMTASLVLGGQAPSATAADRTRVEITNASTGLKADVIWASTAAYQGVFLWPDNTSASQEFDLLDSGGGWFRIRARHSGQCLMLDWRGTSYANGTPVIQYPACNAGYAPAEWRVRWLSGTRCDGDICTTGINKMLLVNRRTGRCLDAANGSGRRPPAQSRLAQWDCVGSTTAWNADNQSWSIGAPGSVPID